MLKEAINGVCMAIADSVPGVSGGTIAFIMGFYDKFIGSINNIVFGNKEKKKGALKYLVKLGTGWILGMIGAVFILSTLFENHIYIVSSVFIGFILGSIPLVITEEKDNIVNHYKNIIFLLLGIALVVIITFLNGRGGAIALKLNNFSIVMGIKLFFIGMIAISAMFLPGISGSTLLLIFGAYMPVIIAVKETLSFNFSYVPALIFFGCGIITGAITVVKIIKICLEKFRSATIYAILGMMIGSFYAIIMGPTTLDVPQAAISISNFNIIACVIGLCIVVGLQKLKKYGEGNNANVN